MSHRRGAAGTFAPPPHPLRPVSGVALLAQAEYQGFPEQGRTSPGCEGCAWEAGNARTEGRERPPSLVSPTPSPREPVTGGAAPAGARARPRGCHVPRTAARASREKRSKSRDGSRA